MMKGGKEEEEGEEEGEAGRLVRNTFFEGVRSCISLPARGSRDAAFLWLLSKLLFTQTNRD